MAALLAYAEVEATALKPLGIEMERRAGFLVDKIEELRKLRDEAAAAERSRPHLPTIKSAMETATALAAKLDCSTAEQKSEIRATGILQPRFIGKV